MMKYDLCGMDARYQYLSRKMVDATWSKKVMIGPSNVAGLGVFTTRDIVEGETVCFYSGYLTVNNPNNNSKYVLEGKIYNRVKKVHEVRYLDAGALGNAVGRFINDACDTYDGNPKVKVPKKFKTIYHTNVGFRSACVVSAPWCVICVSRCVFNVSRCVVQVS